MRERHRDIVQLLDQNQSQMEEAGGEQEIMAKPMIKDEHICAIIF